MLLVSILVGIVITNKPVFVKPNSDYEEELIDRFGEQSYYEIYDYTVYHLVLKDVIIYKKGLTHHNDLPKFSGDPSDKLNECIDFMSKFSYNYNQSNPNLVELDGGNCQALSIYFKAICDVNSIDCKFDGDSTHMYCLVDIDSVEYKIDIANKQVEEVN